LAAEPAPMQVSRKALTSGVIPKYWTAMSQRQGCRRYPGHDERQPGQEEPEPG